ncbi:hypothetical protein ABK040_015371 [Willaertia magna]
MQKEFYFSYDSLQQLNNYDNLKEELKELFKNELNETLIIKEHDSNQIEFTLQNATTYQLKLPPLKCYKEFKIQFTISVEDVCKKQHAMVLKITALNLNNKNNTEPYLYYRLFLGRYLSTKAQSLFLCNLNEIFINHNQITKIQKELSHKMLPEEIKNNHFGNYLITLYNTLIPFNKLNAQIAFDKGTEKFLNFPNQNGLKMELFVGPVISFGLPNVVFLENNKQHYIKYGKSALFEWFIKVENFVFVKGKVCVKENGKIVFSKSLNCWHQLVDTDLLTNRISLNFRK